MKPGDKFAVNLNEHVVAEAVVIDIEDGKVTLDIPATRIVMGVKSSLTDLPDTEPAVERVLLDPPPAPPTVPQAPNTSVAPAPAAVPSTSIPPDAIGDGLANVKLQEME